MEISSSANLMSQAIFNMNNRSNVTNININNLSEDDAALMEAAKEFEAYFLNMMLKAMRDTIDTDNGFLPQSESQRIFQDMLDEHTTRAASQSGGMGLAQQIFRQMTASRSNIQESLIYNGAYGIDEINQEL